MTDTDFSIFFIHLHLLSQNTFYILIFHLSGLFTLLAFFTVQSVLNTCCCSDNNNRVLPGLSLTSHNKCSACLCNEYFIKMNQGNYCASLLAVYTMLIKSASMYISCYIYKDYAIDFLEIVYY